MNEKSFQKHIARARTFGFKRDVERLHKAGLARGGSLANAVVVDDFNILNTEIPIQRDGNVGDGGTVDDPTNPSFNFSTAWQRPRSYELGFRVEF